MKMSGFGSPENRTTKMHYFIVYLSKFKLKTMLQTFFHTDDIVLQKWLLQKIVQINLKLNNS